MCDDGYLLLQAWLRQSFSVAILVGIQQPSDGEYTAAVKARPDLAP